MLVAYGCWGGAATEERKALIQNLGAVLKVGSHLCPTTDSDPAPQEGFKHVDTAWFYREYREFPVFLSTNERYAQARRSNWV